MLSTKHSFAWSGAPWLPGSGGRHVQPSVVRLQRVILLLDHLL